MKNVILMMTLVALAVLPGCNKLKFDDKPYFKFSIDGATELNYEDGDVTGKMIEVNGRKVVVVDNERAHNNGNVNGWFYIQGRTDLPLNQDNPVLRALNDDAYLKWNSKEYRLTQGTMKYTKMDVSVSPNNAIEGTFNLYLANVSNSSETVNVRGSFFHNNYDH